MGSVPMLGFVLGLLIVAGLCNAASNSKTTATTLFHLIGAVECADCQAKNIKPTHAFSGLGVTIDCKLANGEVKRKGYGEMDKEGNFKVLADGVTPKDECYAQLHGASGIPCSTEGGTFVVEQSKTSDGKGDMVILRPAKKLKFSSETCTSAYLWPYYKFPPLPDHPNWFHKPILSFPPHKGFGLPPFPWHFPKKKLPCPIFKKPLPPVPIYKKPLPPPTPVYVKPLPPPVPVYVKPLPPPVPVYEKPNPPPVPVYEKKPHPPPTPVYKKKPCPPIYKKPLPPLPHLPPIYKKPLPPLPHFPPIYKKPLPPLPHFPPIYKKPLPPLPHFPPIYKKPLPPLPHFPPIYKKPLPPLPQFPPIYKKPLPPLPQFPPIYKKPLPPLPKFPPIYKKPPCPPITLPKIPPKFFHHPKINHLPSLPWVPPHA